MQLSKSMLLPILGLVLLGVFNVLSYLYGAIFLDRILICSLILLFVFIAKVREHGQETTVSSANQSTNRLMRSSS